MGVTIIILQSQLSGLGQDIPKGGLTNLVSLKSLTLEFLVTNGCQIFCIDLATLNFANLSQKNISDLKHIYMLNIFVKKQE